MFQACDIIGKWLVTVGKCLGLLVFLLTNFWKSTNVYLREKNHLADAYSPHLPHSPPPLRLLLEICIRSVEPRAVNSCG